MLNISERGVRRLIKGRTDLGAIKVGKTWRFSKELVYKNLLKATRAELEGYKGLTFDFLAKNFVDKSAYEVRYPGKTYKSKVKRTIELGGEYFAGRAFNAVGLVGFKNYLLEKGFNAGTVRRFLDVISKILDFNVEIGELKENFSKGASKGLKTRKIERYLFKEEYERLSAVCEEGLWLHIKFAINTGLRKGEQENLTWNRIDFNNREMYITNRKSGKDLQAPLAPPALEILEKLHMQGLEKPFRKVGHYEFKDALKKADIKDFRWHDLRHTFATWCVKGWHSWQGGKSMPIQHLRMFLGHSDIKMTERYSHLAVEDLHRFVGVEGNE